MTCMRDFHGQQVWPIGVPHDHEKVTLDAKTDARLWETMPEPCILHGRWVMMTRPTVSDLHYLGRDCADCGSGAGWVVHEMGYARPPQSQVWMWCGACDIGG